MYESGCLWVLSFWTILIHVCISNMLMLNMQFLCTEQKKKNLVYKCQHFFVVVDPYPRIFFPLNF